MCLLYREVRYFYLKFKTHKNVFVAGFQPDPLEEIRHSQTGSWILVGLRGRKQAGKHGVEGKEKGIDGMIYNFLFVILFYFMILYSVQ